MDQSLNFRVENLNINIIQFPIILFSTAKMLIQVSILVIKIWMAKCQLDWDWGYPVNISESEHLWMEGGIVGWMTKTDSGSMVQYRTYNFSDNFSTTELIKSIRVHRDPGTNISYCYYLTVGNVSRVLKLKSQLGDNIIQVCNSSTFKLFTFSKYSSAYFSTGSNLQLLNLSTGVTTTIYNISNAVIYGMKVVDNFMLFDCFIPGIYQMEVYDLNGSEYTAIFYNYLSAYSCPIRNSIDYSNVTNMILKACDDKLQLYSITNGSLLREQNSLLPIRNLTSFSMIALATILCGPYLIASTPSSIVYYSLMANSTDWEVVGDKNYTEYVPPINSVSQLTCLSSIGDIGFIANYSSGLPSLLRKTYTNITINTTNSMNTSNLTNNTNMTNTTNNAIINITNNWTNTINNTQNGSIFNWSLNISNITTNTISYTHNSTASTNTILQGSPALTQPTSFVAIVNHQIQSIFRSPDYIQGVSLVSTVTGLASSNLILRQVLKPILYLIDQFWLYKFHSVSYPYLFQYFTNQTDILTELRIRPNFLNLDVVIPQYLQQNCNYNNTSPFSNRGPTNIFMFQSLKDIYIFNFAIALVQFLLLFLLKTVISKFKHKSFKFQKLYRFFHSNSLCWNLFFSTVQSNIVFITFYCVIQFHCFFSFDEFSKFNLMANLAIFAFILFYSYLSYQFILLYHKIEFSSSIISVGFYNGGGFLLQMILNCLQRFNAALIQSSLINRHLLQMTFKVCLDLIIVTIVLKMKKYFKHNFVFALTILYFLTFLCLDAILLVGTQFLYYDCIQNFQDNQNWNFILIIVVIIICLISILKIIITMLQMLINLYKFVRQKNQLPLKTCQQIKESLKRQLKILEFNNLNMEIRQKKLQVSIRMSQNKNKVRDLNRQCLENQCHRINKNKSLNIKNIDTELVHNNYMSESDKLNNPKKNQPQIQQKVKQFKFKHRLKFRL